MSKKYFQIELLPAAHGDCIWIEYGNTARTRRVLIDGGPIGQYKCLETKINTLQDGDRTLELVVLTHVDTDHVDGLVRLFANKKADWKFDTKDVWFNGWKHLESATLGGNQGEFFSALINARVGAAKWNQAFKGKTIVVPDAGPLPRIKLANDFVVTLLSPTPDTLARMKKAWQKDVQAFAPGNLEAAWAALAQQKKYLPNKTLLGSTPEMDALLERQSTPDNSAANGASIAFLAEFGGHSALLLGDAHAEVVAASITRLLVERGLKCLKVDAVKVAHHGSKANISDELLALIDSPNFLISTNGAIFKHPDTEAIQRIIARSVYQPPRLYFNYRTPFTEKWDDPALQVELGYVAVYNESDTEPMKIRFESGGP